MAWKHITIRIRPREGHKYHCCRCEGELPKGSGAWSHQVPNYRVYCVPCYNKPLIQPSAEWHKPK